MPPLEATLICRDQLLFYRKEGTGTKNLILLHGWGQNGGSFLASVVPTVLAKNYSVVLPDLPGFGKSELPKKPFLVDDYVDVVLDLIKKLKLETPLVFAGHSFGGRISIKIAAQYPELVSKLILIDSAGLRPIQTWKHAMWRWLAGIGKYIFELPGFSHLRAPAEKFFYTAIGSPDYVDSGKLRDTFVKVIEEDLASSAEKITTETLLLWGANDADTPLADAEKLHTLISRSTLAVIQNAGHFPFLEQPAEFQKNLAAFL